MPGAGGTGDRLEQLLLRPAHALSVPWGHQARQEKLLAAIGTAGGEADLYRLPTNCTQELEGLGEYQVLPIWPVLAEHVGPEDIQGPGGRRPSTTPALCVRTPYANRRCGGCWPWRM